MSRVLSELTYLKKVTNQTDLGDKLGYGKSYFSQIMNGAIPLSEKTISKIETLFGINKNFLRGESDIIFSVSEQNASYGDYKDRYLSCIEEKSVLLKELVVLERKNDALRKELSQLKNK